MVLGANHYSDKFFRYIVEKLKIDIYYKYPRENFDLGLEDVLFLDEDYILNYIEKL